MAENMWGEVVLGVLQEVIGNDEITPDDDFYLAGGHSLLLVRISRKLRIEHGLELPMQAFWADPHVAALMAAARPIEGVAGGGPAVGTQAPEEERSSLS